MLQMEGNRRIAGAIADGVGEFSGTFSDGTPWTVYIEDLPPDDPDIDTDALKDSMQAELERNRQHIDRQAAQAFLLANTASIASPTGWLGSFGEVIGSFIRFGAKVVSPIVAMLSLRSDSARNENQYIHYGFAADAESFSGGLRPGSYATRGPLVDGQSAQRMLSLPHANPPDAYYMVTVPSGIPVVGPMPVPPDFGQPGGGIQFRFPEGTPPGSVTGPYPLPGKL